MTSSTIFIDVKQGKAPGAHSGSLSRTARIKEEAMSNIWNSILVFIVLVIITVVLGVIFFPGH